MTALAYRLLGQFEVESPDWWAARENRLGGSEIAAVMGLSPFESRFSLWHRKKGLVGPQQMNPEMDWGRRLEPAVLAKYMENHPESYRLGCGMFVNNTRSYQLASPDERVAVSVTGEYRIVEAKTSPMGEGWGKGADDIPVYYRAQVLWYLDTLEWDAADVAVLISGYDYREYTVRYDEAEVALMRAAAEEFIDSLAADDRPDIDGHGQTYNVIKELHPDINGEKVDVDPDLAQEFIEARLRLEVAEKLHNKARSELADEMGDAYSAWCNGYKLADRRVKGAGRPYVQAVSSKQLPTLDQLRTAS